MAESAKTIVQMMKDRISKAGKGMSNIFYVKKDGKVRIRFLTDMEKGVVIPFHTKWKEYNHPCLELYGKECPRCKEDPKPAEYFVFTIWNYETKQRELFMYKATKCTPIPAMITMYEEYNTICDRDYIITRQGEATDTVYTVLPLDKKPFKGDEEPYTKDEIMDIVFNAYPADDNEDEKPSRKRNENVITDTSDFDEDEEIDYSEWSNKDLKAECKKRGFDYTGKSRQEVIEMLSDNVPF